jgi:hypothetical protein
VQGIENGGEAKDACCLINRGGLHSRDQGFSHHDETVGLIGPDPWPPRIVREGLEEHETKIGRIGKLQAIEFAIDTSRNKLELQGKQNSTAVGWNNWQFHHIAYHRVVPHHQSLLNDRSFDTIVLDLIHEVTHILGLRGGLGVANCACEFVTFGQSYT